MVSAHTLDASQFFDSEVDSGYSIDNLAPAAPTGLVASVTEGLAVALACEKLLGTPRQRLGTPPMCKA